MYPEVAVIRRGGEINAWDNADFRAAVEATGKKQVIVAGITTDVSHLTREILLSAVLNAKRPAGLHDVCGALPA